MPSGPTSYSYRPLKKANREFRLLYLVTGQDPDYQQNDLIAAKLKVASLNDLPEYTALSYCWTSAAAQHTIRVHGHPFSVRPNLFEFLKILKEERHTGLIFIDAICINQDDLDERSGQVQMMGQIYRSAVKTTAWLCSLPTAEEAFLIDAFDGFTYLRANEPARARSHDFWEDAREYITRTIWSSHYWTRMWIVQEIILAQTLTFQLGRLKLESHLAPELLRDNHKTFLNPQDSEIFATLMRRNGIAPGDLLWNIWTFGNLLRFRAALKVSNGSKCTLMTAITAFAHQICSDPHDNLFGILGLAADPIMYVDYSMPLSELYVRILVTSACEIMLLTDGTRIPKRQLHGPPHSISGVPTSLALALGWSILHPTVALLIQEATGSLQYQIWSRLNYYKIWSDWSLIGVREALFNAIPWLDFVSHKALCAWLNVCKIRNATMKMPGGSGEARRYSEWVQMVEDVKTEVWETMNTPEYIARLEQAFPLEEAGEENGQDQHQVEEEQAE